MSNDSEKIPHKDLIKAFKSNPIHWFAMGFGTGLAPQAPGTFGTLATLPFILLTASQNLSVKITILLIICVCGIWLCGQSARALGSHDHGSIVWDEIAGFYLTMLFCSVNWKTLMLGFVLFRIFDIIKPWPIKYLDKHVHGGLGIMLDDIVAGLLSGVVLMLLLSFAPIGQLFL